MSDSSEDEDLSRFKDVVDRSFEKALTDSKVSKPNEYKAHKSERYLDEATHYNDLKVPEEMQKRIGIKLSALIQKKYEFEELETENTVSPCVDGGVKLFKDSKGFLSCQVEKDSFTEIHNIKSRKRKKDKKIIDDSGLSEQEKIDAVAVTGEHILSKKETKHWKSRRKEKMFKYRSKNGSKVLIATE